MTLTAFRKNWAKGPYFSSVPPTLRWAILVIISLTRVSSELGLFICLAIYTVFNNISLIRHRPHYDRRKHGRVRGKPIIYIYIIRGLL